MQEQSPQPVDIIRQESTPNEAANYYHYGNSIKKSIIKSPFPDSGSKDSGSHAKPYQSYLVNQFDHVINSDGKQYVTGDFGRKGDHYTN